MPRGSPAKIPRIMASHENKLLLQIITKLGLAGHDSLVAKSTELQRLLQIRSSSGMTSNLSDSAKTTLCIDLAAGLLGLPIDTEMALKLSGLRKTAYSGGRRTLEKILDINRTIGIAEICVQLGLSQVQKEATVLLEAYKRYISGGGQIDFTHPQYATMAVFQACKRLKMKPPKTKLVPFSALKPAQWTLLEKNWEKCLANVDLSEAKAKVEPSEARMIESKANDSTPAVSSSRNHESPEKTESYQSWKKRMLEKAYRELELQRSSG
ncbi:origin recognition complex subunit 6 [Anopheles darlingi]|uniref:Origin recognition complex subunit 6 n=1 Tax=Anopheles darlingi TaxID=43151 RepID=W5J968_ANODA|nr:origin recognition complex subunit 6 [Anopheles darlingi]